MTAINFTGQVAIVTGAGGGLGRQHAIELARRGAKVVVNDLGGSRAGEGASDAARQVVAEIEAAGGAAIADGGSVTDQAAMDAMARRAFDAWGRIDLLVANAGFVRDRSFAKLSAEDFDAVVAVHLGGTAKATKAVWETMRSQNHGRIVFTTSGSGLYGSFGQSNYAAAKMGIVGLMNTLKLEGVRHDIRVNTISPLAATRMTDGLFAERVASRIGPEHVTAGVIYLLSDDAPNGVVLTAGGGVFTVSQMVDSEGLALPRETLTPELIGEHWADISDLTGARGYDGPAFGERLMQRITA